MCNGHVLNALRHQWFGSTDWDGLAISTNPTCSTPCGISGLAGTSREGRDSASGGVLNALRHQWFGRSHPAPGLFRKLSVLNALAASVVWQNR